MSDIFRPANTNESLSQIMANPHGDAVRDVFAPTLRLLAEAGVPDAQISEQLFAFAKAYAVPRDHSDRQAIAGWYAQLHRFRDDLNTLIQRIEGALDKCHEECPP